MTRQRAVFLDRDGVINQAVIRGGKPYPPASVDELVIPRGAAVVLRALKEAGFVLLVVTNQPDIARGKQSVSAVEAIHRALQKDLPLDDIFLCPHDDADRCTCRKPRPGLLFTGAALYHLDLSRSFMVGDRWRDIEAGAQAGCTTVWIDFDYQERRSSVEPSVTVNSLTAAVDWILDQP